MLELVSEPETINFGDLPEEIDALLQQARLSLPEPSKAAL